METELQNLIFVWISVIAALSSCRYISILIPVGPKRLFFFLPVILLFLLLPLRQTTLTLAGLTSFSVAWLSNFKLLLLAYGKGPLVTPPTTPPLSLQLFVTTASLPIKISPSAESPTSKNGGGGGLKSRANYVAKCLLLVSLFPLYQRSAYVHEKVMMLAYSVHVYIVLEVALAVIGPQFDEPYLATSLQDFWGRRWNLMATSILRPSVYEPIRLASGRLVGRRAALPAVLITFAVSALMHELIFYYIGRKEPTWVVTRFFLLHGVAVAAEVAAKKAVSRVLTVGFVVVTGFWLFLPLRYDTVAKARRETIAVIEFVKCPWSLLRFISFTVISGRSSLYTD
ncbi:hypothetical protein ACJRO7_022048 [Eucalyptus globulus]|uniref:Wax synthase domain-containing protein n=1 Tax=Eucalyptus globulus TaxID=34317 RepID=A0ABD3KP99_EUCGL